MDALEDFCDVFATAPSPDDAARLAAERLSATFRGAGVRVVLVDPGGRLRTASRRGRAISGGRLRSSRRREVLARGVPCVIRLSEPSKWSLALMPMVPAGVPVGLVEVAAPDGSLRPRLPDLERTVHGLGVGLHLCAQRHELKHSVNGLEAALKGVDSLLKARSADEAVRFAVGMIHTRLRRPIVGIALDPKGGLLQALGIRGLDPARRAAVRHFVEAFSSPPRFGKADQIRLANGISGAANLRAVHLAFSGPVVVVAGRPDHIADHRFVELITAMLASALERLDEVDRARQRNEHLDLSIAWTAHELRTPLLATKIVLEQASARASDPIEAAFLERARDELAGTAGLIGPLLRWAAGRGTVRRRSIDLVHLVHAAVAMAGSDARERVRVGGLSDLWVSADPVHLRAAIVNVVRNAVAFAPPATDVDIDVIRADDAACVIVRDRGPGIPAREREAIFDPFTRGAVQTRGPGGTGLGLFISRRILEAHGGTVRLLPSRLGAQFCIELPVAVERRSASAS